MSRASRAAVLGLGLALLLTLGLPIPAAPVHAAPAARVLVYGDSLTQGSSGDWTWRCRLWRHLTSTGTPVDMVGPRHDLWHWRGGTPGSTLYADPGCDRDHASVWGMRMRDPVYDLSATVQSQQPDVVVGLLGINDLLYGLLSPAELIDRWRTEIAQSRAAAPATDFVLVPVPETWYDGVTDYDQRLAALAGELDTTASRVVTAADPGFVEDRDTIDHTHPSANGELRIAAVVADALSVTGLGRPWPRPLVAVPPGPGFAPTPRLSAVERQLRVTWPAVDYADAERVWVRDLTRRTAWRMSVPLGGTSWWDYATGGHTYAVRLQPRKGMLDGGTLSTTVTARVPARPDAVTRLHTTRLTRCRALVGWRAATYATGYAVLLRDATRNGAWHVVGRPRLARLATGRLVRHHQYDVSVRSYGPLLGGTTVPVRFRSC